MMLAAVYRRYGGPEVVQVEQVPKPTPKADEVLIRIKASTVSSGDMRVRSLNVPRGFGIFTRPVFGFWAPRQKILGSELAGTIEAVGAKVTNWKVGDDVFAFPDFSMGCHAQYRTMPANGKIERLPAGMDFTQAATLCFGNCTALGFLRQLGKIKAGEQVLVIGASGAVGAAAVQLAARHFGAHVTGVTSTGNVQLVRELGAERVIDYKQEDWLAEAALDPSKRYDIIFDTVGATDFPTVKAALKEDGRLLMAAADLYQLIAGARGGNGKQKALGGGASGSVEDLRLLRELVEGGALKAVVDRTVPLERIAEAHALVDSGRKRGSVVVTMS